MTVNRNLGYPGFILAPQWAPDRFFMTVGAQNPHVFRIPHQIPVRDIGWMRCMLEMGDCGYLILDRKRHRFLGWMIARRAVMADLAVDAPLNDGAHHLIVLVCFPVNAGRPFGVDFLMARLAGCGALMFRQFGRNLRYRGTAVVAVLMKRILYG
ncbi:MAG: hypothetical protein Q7T29_00890 [Gallionella sp.]|nr:hypothetical protein [Gallionella sp.]